MPSTALETFSTRQKILAYAVHVYTASGIIFCVLMLTAILKKQYHMAFFYNCMAVLIDSSDGWLARKFRVKEVVPHINGRTLDDLVDFVNYTFLPLFMIWHMGLLPGPAWLWICIPMIASLFAFADEGVKEEKTGFFVGFPSYWNFFAVYAYLAFRDAGPWFTLALLLIFSAMNVSNMRFVYPNQAKRWKAFFLGGALVWTAVFLYMLTIHQPGVPWHLSVPRYLTWGSFSYPVLYIVLSIYLDREGRREDAKAAAEAGDGRESEIVEGDGSAG